MALESDPFNDLLRLQEQLAALLGASPEKPRARRPRGSAAQVGAGEAAEDPGRRRIVRNYYLVLGVPRDETAEGIRAAYRALVKHHHPDLARAADVTRFRELAEAYGILSDDEGRRRYNATLAPDAAASPRPISGGGRWPDVEPLAVHDVSLFAEPLSAPAPFREVHPSLEELLAHLRRTATGIGRPKGGRLEEVHVEVLLAPDEAARGGAIDIGIPVPQRCRGCAGTGDGWYGRCHECGGLGVVEREALVRVRIPSLARDTTLGFPLRALGLDDVALQVNVRIAPWSALG
jgi:DnaJ domain